VKQSDVERVAHNGEVFALWRRLLEIRVGQAPPSETVSLCCFRPHLVGAARCCPHYPSCRVGFKPRNASDTRLVAASVLWSYGHSRHRTRHVGSWLLANEKGEAAILVSEPVTTLVLNRHTQPLL